ncbi:unnamed protein product [Mytilus edulis]|uniref:C1q domain-containing protein n=1 Tax=Mytilus edulis TaxID=6550 RepID=A0A8S3RR83_MYTED|nr:unnamed protein product [Mytilus edulis]
MKFGLFGFLIIVLAVSVKSETQNIKIHDLMLDEIQNKHYAKILKLETMVMAMNEQLNRQDEKIRSQNERIHEQQRRLNDQDITIRRHDRQINDVVQHVSELQDSTINDEPEPINERLSNQSFETVRTTILWLSESRRIPTRKTSNTRFRCRKDKRWTCLQQVQWNVYCSSEWCIRISTGMHSYVYSQLVINSDPFGAIQTDSDEVSDYHTSTGSVVAELNYGDVVYIRTHPTELIKGVIRSEDEMRTSFSGWKL